MSIKAYRFQLRTRPGTERLLRRFAGSCRWVWNQAIAQQQRRHAAGEKFAGHAAMCKWLTGWRHAPETIWLAETPIHPQQQTLRRLEAAYQRFFAGQGGYPKFKGRGQDAGLRFPDPKQFALDQANARTRLPKLGWLRLRQSRPVPGTLKNATVTQERGRWFVSLQVEVPDVLPAAGIVPTLGIDLGVALFAATSDGQRIEPLNALKRQAKRLKHAQRSVSRKVKGSRNRRKAIDRLGRLHARIAHQRADWLHKLSTQLADAHPVIAIEDLTVQAMSASAAGTPDKPGRRMRQKAGLNRAILDQGWAEFRRQLEYKTAARGGAVVPVPAAYTSQTCRVCGHVSPNNRPTQARFACVACGHTDNADLNAAQNILAAGHAGRRTCGLVCQDRCPWSGCQPRPTRQGQARRHDEAGTRRRLGRASGRVSRNLRPLGREDVNMTRHITSAPGRQPGLAAALVIALAVSGLSGCSVEWQNLQPARQMARQQSAQAGNLYAGWRLFQDRCAGCHGADAAGQGNAPDLRARLRNLGPRSFASLVLNRYDWGLPGTPPASDTPARETWVDAVVQRQAGTVTMPAWRDEPGVSAHVMDLYAYLAARSEGTQGPGKPTP